MTPRFKFIIHHRGRRGSRRHSPRPYSRPFIPASLYPSLCNTRSRPAWAAALQTRRPAQTKRHCPKRGAKRRKPLGISYDENCKACPLLSFVDRNGPKYTSDSKIMTPFCLPNHNIKTSYVGATYQVARFPAKGGWVTALKRTNGVFNHHYRTSLVGATGGQCRRSVSARPTRPTRLSVVIF